MSAAATVKRRAAVDPLAVLIARDHASPADEQQRNWTRPTLAAAISFLAHGLLLVILGLQITTGRSTDYAEVLPIDANLNVPSALFDNPEGEIETNPKLAMATEPNDQNDAPAKLVTPSEDVNDLGGLKTSELGAGPAANLKEGLPGGGGVGTGADGGGRSEFAGLSAAGRRIVFCVDRSASMNKPVEHTAWAWAQDELVRSIRKLSPTMSFQVVFYSDNVMTLPNPDRRKELIPATEQAKERAIKFIRELDAEGGTKHEMGLDRTFELKPDVVFFMTDADDDTDEDLRRLTNRYTTLNRRKSEQQSRASIHIIQLWHKPGTPSGVIRELPERNNGSYKLVLAKDLGKRIVP
jgi:hypothetical protein